MSKVKRIYIKKAAYFITTNCVQRYPFFEEDIFCNILIDNIASCQQIKSFELIGFKINPDHIHLIIQPTGKYNISQIMQNIKRTTSDHINQLISYKQEENHYEKLKWSEKLKWYNRSFQRKYNYEFHEFPLFKWQISFDDRMIKIPNQLKASVEYLKKQTVKHELKENKFLYINKNLPKDIVFIGLSGTD